MPHPIRRRTNPAGSSPHSIVTQAPNLQHASPKAIIRMTCPVPTAGPASARMTTFINSVLEGVRVLLISCCLLENFPVDLAPMPVFSQCSHDFCITEHFNASVSEVFVDRSNQKKIGFRVDRPSQMRMIQAI